jgi:hypothetical protein
LFRARDAGTGAARACSGQGGGVDVTAVGDSNTTARLTLGGGDGSVTTTSLCMGQPERRVRTCCNSNK